MTPNCQAETARLPPGRTGFNPRSGHPPPPRESPAGGFSRGSPGFPRPFIPALLHSLIDSGKVRRQFQVRQQETDSAAQECRNVPQHGRRASLSVIYSLLSFGQYFERNATAHCDDVLVAVTPVVRTMFVIMQMIFVFANNGKFLASPEHSLVSRFGLMHMIAANLCKWLYVVVQEAKNDIMNSVNKSTIDTGETQNSSGSGASCWKSRVVSSVMHDAGPYLFPCTVEYSLLCAVILATMWRSACTDLSSERRVRKRSGVNVIYARSISQFSVDFSGANKGLFAGLAAASLSILSLLLFFELAGRPRLLRAALIQADIWEATLYVSSAVAAIACLVAMRSLAHRPDHRRLELEHALLFVSHGGLLLYLVFQMAGVYFEVDVLADPWHVMKVLTPLSALLQSCCQTPLVVDAWRRACSSPQELRRKPGRQLVTFLLVANVCMWAFNRLLNNRPESHPGMVRFYGMWPWTIITHVCVPLVMCYRFQSSVCLYEIWIHVYKLQ
ncbi:hypothetical protein PR048_027533 [Dryococelus australis]|uniref:Otopetrin n=1 Tax=Dryococelus australis TaxID=614101 RepID=A0ABQ9GGS6_9NEOP|nr:hypothetical protein PR048_027533 [Dryococelus australis]